MILRVSYLWLVVAGSLCMAAEPAASDPGTPDVAPAAEASRAPAVSADAESSPPVLREQTIYIPYEKLKQVFEKEGRGVFLPYAQFQRLWEAARKSEEPPPPPQRPVEALIRAIDSEATIGDQVVDVVATLQVEVLGEGWVTVPLRLRNSAIRSATVGGGPARIVFDPKEGYQLLHEKKGREPEQFELRLAYSRAYSKTPGQSQVVFEAPQSPINRWNIRVPETGISVAVEPMIAATRIPEVQPESPEAGTRLLAFVGGAPTVRIIWNPKAEGAAGLTAFSTVQVEQQVSIAEGVLRSTVHLAYEISRSTLAQLVLEVPADQKVVNVFDRNVKRWKPVTDGAVQRIEVELFEPTQGTQALVLELEQFTKATETSYDVGAPLVVAVGAGRQQGTVVVRLDEGLRAEATKRVGLMQLDQNDLPETLRKTPWAFAYRYGAVPYELQLRVEKIQPRISVTELVEAALSSERLDLTWQGLYEIEDAGVFQLRVDLPDGFEIRSVQGKAIGNAQPVAVDSWHRVAEEGNTWLVNLSQKALGAVGLEVQLRKPLDDPNLVTPTGQTSELPIPLPRATAADLEFARGALVLHAPESLRVNPQQAEGMRSTSFAEAHQAIPSGLTGEETLHPVLAYSFTKGPATLTVTAERRRPQITVRQLLRCEIEAGVVKYTASFFYDIKFSGVKSLRIDVPTALTAEIHNAGPTLRQSDISPPPDDLAPDYTAWSFAAETELLGKAQVQLTWEQKIEELQVGMSRTIVLPRLLPRGVDRANGQIVISKSESIDVQPTGEPTGLQPIDPQHDLMPEGQVPDAAMAFEFVDEWTLSVQATRYEAALGKQTAIERGVVRVIALSQGELSVQALFRVRSARQRLAIELPAGAEFDAQPLRINGTPVSPERDSATTIFAPLVDQKVDEPFVLELRYSVPGHATQLDLPSFPDEPAVQKVYLCAYLPEKSVLLASRGPWAGEDGVRLWATTGNVTSDSGPFTGDDDSLLQWVAADSNSGLRSARSFPVGKSQLHVYSTLRPAAAPEGSLCLTTMHRNLFHGLIILLVAAVGLPLFQRSLALQGVLLLLMATVLLLIGAFVPELGVAVLFGIFPVAVAVLILIWAAGHLLVWRAHFRRGPRPPDGSAQPPRTEPEPAPDAAQPAAADPDAPEPGVNPFGPAPAAAPGDESGSEQPKPADQEEGGADHA